MPPPFPRPVAHLRLSSASLGLAHPPCPSPPRPLLQVHRGPGTLEGEERLVLFCSWRPATGSKASAKQQSETDYSFYDSHLEPKLRLSERARRSEKRRNGGSPDRGGPRRSRQRRHADGEA